MKKINLKRFLQDGILGSFELGMTKQQALEYLRTQEIDFVELSEASVSNICFSNYELLFESAKLISIQVKDYTNCESGHKRFMHIDESCLFTQLMLTNCSVSMNQMRLVLGNNDIAYIQDQSESGSESLCFESGVYMNFINAGKKYDSVFVENHSLESTMLLSSINLDSDY